MFLTISIFVLLAGLLICGALLARIDSAYQRRRREMIDAIGGEIVVGGNALEFRLFLGALFPTLFVYIWIFARSDQADSVATALFVAGPMFIAYAGASWLLSTGFKPSIVSFWEKGGVIHAGSENDFWFNWEDIAAAGTDGWGCIWMVDRDGKTYAPNSLFGRDRVLEWLIRKCPDRFYLKTNPKTFAVMERG
jgi:hypothetical protein